MPMRKSKLVPIVVTVVIVTSSLAYTGLSNATEPRLYGLKVTPQSYAVNIEDSAQSNPSLMGTSLLFLIGISSHLLQHWLLLLY